MAGTDGRREAAAALTGWFASVPPARRDWAEALLAAALDEAGGDLAAALEMARAEFDADPDGPAGGPVEMALGDGPDSASDLVDAILARGAAAGVGVAENLKERIQDILKKKPPRRS